MLRDNRNAGQAGADTKPAGSRRHRKRIDTLRDDMRWLRGDLQAIDSELAEGKLEARAAVFEALSEIDFFLRNYGTFSAVFFWVLSDADRSQKDALPPHAILEERFAELNQRRRWARTRPRRPKPAKERLRELHYDFAALRDDLVAIDANFQPGNQRWAILCALRTIARFFREQGASKPVLSRLIDSLKDVREPAAKRRPGRKGDPVSVRSLKGQLAAIARLHMQSGLPREQAAERVARLIPHELASRLSSKGFITTRSVQHYMDQYDCGPGLLKKFEQPAERKRFETLFKRRQRPPRRVKKEELRQQLDFLMENAPRKLCDKDQPWKNDRTWNAVAGLFGFAQIMHFAADATAEGYNFSADEIVKALCAFPENAHLAGHY